MPKAAKKTVDIGHEMEYVLATGNLRSRSGLGLQQVSVTLVLTFDIQLVIFVSWLFKFLCICRYMCICAYIRSECMHEIWQHKCIADSALMHFISGLLDCCVCLNVYRTLGSPSWQRSSTSTATCLTSEQSTEEPSSQR